MLIPERISMKLIDAEYDPEDYGRRNVRFIGITGGVGCGKSSVMSYLSKRTGCRCFTSDEEAKKLYIPGSPVFEKIIEAAGNDVIDENGELIKERFAKKIFADDELRKKIDGIVHPAVQGLILDAMAKEKISGKHDFFFIEAALLIECGYKEILNELWYVYASEDTRRARLKADRGYSDEKADAIFASQRSDKEYRKNCDRVIDNDGSIEDMHASVDKILKGFGN